MRIGAAAGCGVAALVLLAWFAWPGPVFWVDRYWDVAITTGWVDPAADAYPWTVAVAWSPDGTTLASGGYHHDVLLWDAASGALEGRLRGHRSWVQEVIWFDPHHVASADWDGVVIVWDVATGEAAATLEAGDETDVFGVAVHPTEPLLAAGTYAGTTFVLDWRTDELLAEFESNPGGTLFATFTPDGEELVTAGEDGHVRFFATHTWTETRAIPAHDAGITSVSFTADGATMLSGGDDGMVRLWDVASGEQRGAWRVARDWVNFCHLLPDGRRFLTAGTDGHIGVWQVDRDEPVADLPLHSDWAQCVRPSRDGRSFASTGKEGTIQVYDLDQGRLLHAIDVDVAIQDDHGGPGTPFKGVL